jgi:hypothetical protein
VRPAEHKELEAIEGLDERADESDEAAAVQREGNDAMMFEEKVKSDVFLEHAAEVLVDRLAVKVVVRAEEKVPRNGSEPRQLVIAVHHVANRDYLDVKLENEHF